MPVTNPPSALRKSRMAAPATGDSQFDVDPVDPRTYSTPLVKRTTATTQAPIRRRPVADVRQTQEEDEDGDTVIFQDIAPEVLRRRRNSSITTDRHTTGSHRSLPITQVHHRQHIGVRELVDRVRGSWMMKVSLTMLGFLLMWLLYTMSTGVAHWYAGNQYSSYGSTHGSMTVAYLGDGDSATKQDQVYALLTKGQIVLITGNDPAHMHVYPGVLLDANGINSKEVTLNVTVKDMNGDGHPDVQIIATDWSSLDILFRPETLAVNFYSNGKGGFKGGA